MSPPDAALRVLHVIGTSDIGGTERFLVRLLERIDGGAFRSGICVLDRPAALASRYRAVSERVEHLGLSPARVLPAVRLWRRLLSDWRPHVLVLYGFRANLLGRLLHFDTPVVAALRSVFVDERRRASAAWLDRLTFGRVSVCVGNSLIALDLLRQRGYPPERLVHVPNAVDLAHYRAIDRPAARSALGVDGDRPVLVVVANLKPAKGHDTLLAASARLNETGHRHRLWLVGEGEERTRLERLSVSLGLAGTVSFVGAEDDVRRRLAAADVAVVPSRWEGMPTALLEAMASGLPIVATRVGEIPNIVEDGVFGRLVPSGDPGALAAALAELLQDDALRRAWGERALEAARRFDLSRTVRQYEAIFRWSARRGATSELPAIAADALHERKAG